MQYSPKLKTAIEEIKQILRKHDIAGIVVLHTPGFGEYLNHITPSYSCASIDNLSGRYQLKGRKEHFSNEAERHNKLKDTCNMMRTLADLTGKSALNLLEAAKATDKFLDAQHEGPGESAHSTQNN